MERADILQDQLRRISVLTIGVPLNVEISQERYAKLQLTTGDGVFVFPKRVRVFVDYQI